MTTDSIPAYVDAIGEKAQASYRRALAYGSTYDKRVKILIVGQDRVGKTSLGKFLRGERFDRNEPSTNGVKMFLPVKNAGTDAWRNLDSTHVFDHKVTAEMTRESHNATAKPQNEIEEEEIQDQMTAASKEELQTNPGGSKIFKNIRYFLKTFNVSLSDYITTYITLSTDYYQRFTLKTF